MQEQGPLSTLCSRPQSPLSITDTNCTIKKCMHSLLFQNLEDKERKHSLYKEQLSREQRFLRRRLEQLNAHRYSSLSKRRSVSECSSSTVSSSHSTVSHSSAPSPISESGEYLLVWRSSCAV